MTTTGESVARISTEPESPSSRTVDIAARLKSLDPVTSIGPSTPVRIVEIVTGALKLRVGHSYVPHAVVQIIAGHRVMMGEVRCCEPSTDGFQLEVTLVENW
jgi:hypothetical protein